MIGRKKHSHIEPGERRAVGVDICHVNKRFHQQVVLDDVHFSIEPGEIFVIMGPSGAGKSTLMRAIVNLEGVDSGDILINGESAFRQQTHVRMHTAIVFQAGGLFNSLTVYDNLAFYPREHRLYDRKTLHDKVHYTLQILNLAGCADKYPAELSGGMRKRVAIARSLLIEPRLLLYDEPTSELDPLSAANIAEVIGTLKEEFDVTSIVVSHDRDLAINIGERVALMEKGRVVTIDTPEGLCASTNPVVREFLQPTIDCQKPRFRQAACGSPVPY